MINKLSSSKATGPDAISVKLLNMLSPVFSHPLIRLFNLGTFPSKRKVTRITPLYKNGAHDSRDNNRPISLLSVLSKVMETHVATSFVNYLAHSELLYNLQSAFCEGHSTESALIKLTNKILFSLDRDEVTGMIFVDFGKAFYIGIHQPLLSNLRLNNASDSHFLGLHNIFPRENSS